MLNISTPEIVIENYKHLYSCMYNVNNMDKADNNYTCFYYYSFIITLL